MSPASARVGMVGAGQLAQMTQQAAIGLGVELLVLTDDPLAPAVRAGARRVPGTGTAAEGLLALARESDVVTFDHEHSDPQLLDRLAERALVRPSPASKRMAQDKLHARRALAELGFEVPLFTALEARGDIEALAERCGWPLIIKTRSGGYDGHGVWTVQRPQDALALMQDLEAAGRPAIAEEMVDIDIELAVVLARNPTGQIAVYPVLETRQRGGICREVIAPAAISPEQADQARRLAVSLADGLDVAGVLAVEMFLSGGRLLVNELALRPHNSAHLTIEGCGTSQFEQHLRGVLDWPLGGSELLAPACAMVNILGTGDGSDPRLRLPQALGVPQAHVHLYGKEPRSGRKLGHVTALGADGAQALERAQAAASALVGA